MNRLITTHPLQRLGLLLLVTVLLCVQVSQLKVASGPFWGSSGTAAGSHSESRAASGVASFGGGSGVGAHDRWSYNNSSLGAAPSLAIAIVSVYFLGPVYGLMASNLAIGTINNGGDIEQDLKYATNSD